MTPQEFADEFSGLIKRGLEANIAPKFLVMELSLMEHELANFHIKLKRDGMEKELQEKSSGIIALDGSPVNQN